MWPGQEGRRRDRTESFPFRPLSHRKEAPRLPPGCPDSTPPARPSFLSCSQMGKTGWGPLRTPPAAVRPTRTPEPPGSLPRKIGIRAILSTIFFVRSPFWWRAPILGPTTFVVAPVLVPPSGPATACPVMPSTTTSVAAAGDGTPALLSGPAGRDLSWFLP